MNGMFVRTARRSSLAQIRHVAPVRPDTAPDLVARIYAQVESDFGMLAPPIALHAAAPEVLAASWLMLRETLLASGEVDRAAKETVGTAVSRGNACPYCVEVHSATLRGLSQGVGADGLESITDPVLRDIAVWAGAAGRRDVAARHEPPFGSAQTPELVGVAVTFQYLNRMVNVFLRESPFPPGLSAAARDGLMRLLARILQSTTRQVRRPGIALDLLPAAPLPDDFAWAAGNPSVAGAFARATAAIETAGARSVPQSVRSLVTAELARWDGAAPGIGRTWADDVVSTLPPGDRPAGRLALLTAMASYQVSEPVIDEFRLDQPGDAALIELTAWASMAAARQVGSWSGGPLADLHA